MKTAWGLFPDVVDTLDALGSFRLGVISNGASLHQRQKLEAVGILDRFEIVVISEDVGVAKPDPQVFKAACQAAGAPPSACLARGRSIGPGRDWSLRRGAQGRLD